MFGALKRTLLPLLGAAAVLGLYASVDAKLINKADLHAKQAEAAARIRANLPRATGARVSTGVKNITFTNPRASGKPSITHTDIER